MLIYWQNRKLRLKQTLTVFHEDVNHALFKTVFDDVLVGLHHVGAEDVLVAAFSHVGSGRSSVCFQQVGAASLRGKHKPVSGSQSGVQVLNRAMILLFVLLSIQCICRYS